MARIEATVTMQGIYEYNTPSYAGYGYDTHYIYNMIAEDGTVYVWKTTAFLYIEVVVAEGEQYNGYNDKGEKTLVERINKGDKIRIKATVKGHSEYKGQPQTEINRVKLVERVFRAKTPEEIEAEKKAAMKAKQQAQRESLKDGDFIWQMPYKQFKEHYSDCETIDGSFERHDRGVSTIKVIIRDGRLKRSGVRGQHYSGYEIKFKDGGQNCIITYRAISEETALKRFEKDFPDAEFIGFGKIYNYR